jgi:23S rRNA pseudouridine2605 synthase
MTDDSKKPPRGGKPGAGGKGRGPRDGGRPGARGGKPGFGEKRGFGGKPASGAGKPFRGKPAGERRFDRDDAKGEGAPRGDRSFKPRGEGFKPRGDKPFRKREEGASDRLPRQFRERSEGESRSFKPRGEGSGFKPRGEGKPFRPREDGGSLEPRSDRPFRARRAEGEAGGRAERPFRERKSFGDGERQSSGERGDRSFKSRGESDARPGRRERSETRGGGERAERSERPFRSGPRPEGKPFAKRRDEGAASGDRPPRRFDRNEQGGRLPRFGKDGEGFQKRKPFGQRDDGPRQQLGERKPLGMRDDGPPRRSVEGRSFGRREDVAEEVEGERIAKRLARVGIASRRDAEELIAAGRVKVNGRVLESPAFNVTTEDTIELDGKPLPPVERTRLFLFHKPAGVVTTNRDPEGRRTVFDVLPGDLPRLITVGRLDINTEGLLLLTNDGGLARTLELPATGWLRRYRARVHGKVEEQALSALKDGIAVDGVFYGSIEASLDREQGTNAWLTIGLREGKNREVKNILGALGLDVTRLIRISFGPFQLGELPEGHVQELKGRMLREQLGERLIEESGANFEAEIVKPFSNRPVRRREAAADEATRPKIARDGLQGRIGEGGLIKNRKRREGSRDEALGKLSTKPRFERGTTPDFGDRPPRGKKFGEREQRPIEPPGQRKANVWMAPGSRPQGAGKIAAEKAAHDERKSRKPAFNKSGGKSYGKPRGDGPGRGPRSPGKPRKGE